MKHLLFTTLLLLTLAGAHAQEASPEPPQRRDQWVAEMPAGKYIVRLSSITSISMHEYIVDAAARVTEVNVSTTGDQLARFYYIEPLVAQTPDGLGQGVVDKIRETAGDVAARAGNNDLWQKVVKNYPTTTHAHTVEYRLATKESLQKLFGSLEDAFTTRRPGKFKP